MKLSSDEVFSRLVEELGGVDLLYEMLREKLSEGANGFAGGGAKMLPGEDTEGYCYLRFFSDMEQAAALALGSFPTVADIRRFSNSRADPFGSRSVVAVLQNGPMGRYAHVSYNAGPKGLRPLQALSGLAKEVRVGGLPDGVSEDFPPAWIPAKRDVYQTWNFIDGDDKRNLNILDWLGPDPLPDDRSGAYEPISSKFSRVKWVLKASPVGPSTGKIDLIDAAGNVRTMRQWESMVGPWGHYQEYAVRGSHVFVEAHVWRPAKVTTTPGAPTPTPPARSGDKEDLLTSGFKTTLVGGDCGEAFSGKCYIDAFKEAYHDKVSGLGRYPTVQAILAFLMVEHAKEEVRGEDLINDRMALDLVQPGLYHVSKGDLSAVEFLEKLFELPMHARIGATQSDAVTLNRFENTAMPATLAILPRAPGQILSIPFASKLTMDKPQLFWSLTGGKKLAGLMAYFESVELVSLRVKATMHKGDADSLLSIAVDTANHAFTDDMDWVASSHTLHLSGNINGATTGELVLEGNHGFGTQLKGVAVGNLPPVLQAYLDTAVVANALIKAVLTVRVSGTGNGAAIILAPMSAARERGLANHEDSDEGEPSTPSGKRVSKG